MRRVGRNEYGANEHELGSDSGQALVELALSLPVLLISCSGIIDFSRAIYSVEVIKNLTGEGSSMALRGTSLLQTAQAVVADAGTNLDLTNGGCVIVTAVFNTGGTSSSLQVAGQSAPLGACGAISSKIGCLPPRTGCGNATLPPEAAAALQANQTLYAEIFYSFSAVTPISSLLQQVNVLPTQLYDAAYY